MESGGILQLLFYLIQCVHNYLSVISAGDRLKTIINTTVNNSNVHYCKSVLFVVLESIGSEMCPQSIFVPFAPALRAAHL